MNKFTQFITQNWQVKVMMLVVAAGLWIFVSLDQSRSGKFPGAIKIDTRNTSSGTVAVLSEEYAELTIQATQTKWQSLQPDQFEVYVDLKDLGTGTHEVNVQARSKVNGVSISTISPKKVIVNIEPVITRELPVTVVIQGEPATGFIVGSYKADPATATISAARSIVASIDQITAEVDLNGESESLTRNVELQVANKLKDNVTVNPTNVGVSVSIVESGRNRTVGIKPNIIGSPKEGYYISAITITPSTITIEGDANVINAINSVNTEEININNVSADKTYDVGISTQSGISLSNKSVQVRIAVDKIST